MAVGLKHARNISLMNAAITVAVPFACYFALAGVQYLMQTP
jgi:hypothetical protein